jgi:hypothetical protein
MKCRFCKKETNFGTCKYCNRWNDACVLMETAITLDKKIMEKVANSIRDQKNQEKFTKNHIWQNVINSLQKFILE